MNDTPETDAAQFGTGRVSVEFARRLERERDEAREQNAKLREIAEWFADHFVDECYELPHEDHELHERRGHSCPVIERGYQLRAELDQLKEGGK